MFTRLLKIYLCVGWMTLAVLLNASPALAHKVSIFAWIQGDIVHTQSKFMGGKRPNQAQVEVFDDAGRLLLKGQTDAQGRFSFQAPRKSNMQIVLMAGMGHRAEWRITAEDFLQAAGSAMNDLTTKNVPPTISTSPDRTLPSTEPSQDGDRLTKKEIRTLIESVLDQKLSPLSARIAELNEERVTLTDIFGGLGYIIGLVGLAAYMNSRRKKRDGAS